MRGRPIGAGLVFVVAAACGHAPIELRAPSALASLEDGGPAGSPCRLAKDLRARGDELAAAGRLDRAVRTLDRAAAECPAQAPRTYRARLSLLLELGRDDEARALSGRMLSIEELSAEAKLAKLALDRAKPRDLERARALTVEAMAAGARGDHARARDRFVAANAAAPTDGEPLLGAGLSSLRLGEPAAAQRFLDRAAVALERAAGEKRVVDLTNGPTAAVRIARFSPAGDAIAIAHGKVVTVYAGPDLGLARTLRGHDDLVAALAFSPDGTHLATGSRDRTVRIWDLRRGKVERTLATHAGPMSSLAWSVDGMIATASYDKSARVFRASDGSEVLRVDGALAMTAVSFAPDGGTVAIGGLDRVVRIVDVKTGSVVRSLAVLAGITALAHAPSGAHLAVGTTDARVFVFDLKTGWQIGTLLGHSEHITDVAYSSDGTALASASADATARVWEPGVGYNCRKTLEGHVARVTAVSFHPGTSHIATGSEDRAVLLWDSHTGAHVGMIGAHADGVTAVAVAPDHTIAMGSRDALVRLVRVQPFRVTALAGHVAAVGALSFTPDSAILASGADDNTVRTWDVASATLREVLRGHKAAVSSLAINADGTLLASGARDGTLRVVDPRTGTLRAKRRHHPAIESVAFSPDNLLASGGVDGTIQIGPAMLAPTITIRHWSEPILALAFLDDIFLASGSADGSVGTFSVLDGTRIAIDEGHHDAVTGLSVTNGIVSSSADGTMRWSGRTISGHEEAVLALASLDGDRVISGGSDGSLRVFMRNGTFVVGLRALRRVADAWAFTADGYFDARGEARAVATCRIGAVHHPIELCEERYAVDDLWSRALRGDTTFRD